MRQLTAEGSCSQATACSFARSGHRFARAESRLCTQLLPTWRTNGKLCGGLAGGRTRPASLEEFCRDNVAPPEWFC